jgi:1-acyl-sn-glycerol-3-phosphate acyltransferase
MMVNPLNPMQWRTSVATLLRRLFYRGLRLLCRMIAVVSFGLRTEGRHHLDVPGGGMLLSSHQSMLDPVLVGLIANRRLNYLARKTLFKNFAFGFLIRVLDAIEIDRERGGLAGLRELVLLFPEGTRTSDGQLGALKPGFIPVARRSQVPLIPIAIVGAYECLPKGAKLPTRMPVAIMVGEPVQASSYMPWSDAEILHELNLRLKMLHRRGTEFLVSAR